MGSASTKAGIAQSKLPQEKIDKVQSMVNPKREMGGGAFGKCRSRKRARKDMLDRQLATRDSVNNKMRQSDDISTTLSNLTKQQNTKPYDTQRFALRGMKGSALAKIVKDNKAKSKRHLK